MCSSHDGDDLPTSFLAIMSGVVAAAACLSVRRETKPCSSAHLSPGKSIASLLGACHMKNPPTGAAPWAGSGTWNGLEVSSRVVGGAKLMPIDLARQLSIVAALEYR